MINIWSIIDPIKNEIANKAWQVVNEVTGRIWSIVGAIVGGLEARLSGVLFNVGNMIGNIVSNLQWTIGNLQTTIHNSINGIVSTLYNVVGTINNAVHVISNAVQNAIAGLSYTLSNKIESIKHSIEFTISNVLNNGINVIRGVLNNITDGIRILIGNIQNVASTIINGITSNLSSLASSIVNQVRDYSNIVINSVNTIIGSLKNLVTDKLNYIESRLNSIWDNVRITINDMRNYVINQLDYARQQLSIRIGDIANDVKAFINAQIDAIKGRFEQIGDSTKKFFSEQLETLKKKVEKIMNDLQTQLEGFVKRLDDQLDSIRDIVTDELEGQFNKLNNIIKKINSGQYETYDEFIADFNAMGGSGGLINAVVGTVAAVSTYLHSVYQVGTPFAQNIHTLAMSKATPSVLPPSIIAQAWNKGLWNEDQALNELRANGFNESRANTLLESTLDPSSPGEAQIAFLRGMIDERKHDEFLRKYGYTDDRIELLKQLYVIIPPVSDLITMSVREVFSPETAERFGQFEDFPVEFAEFASQQGLSRDWAMRYWASHWSLPSPTQGFEMLHRRIIGENDLKLLLKALDIMPFWREKLIQLSYNPLTRVDVRRMHKVGVLTESEVYESYLDIGYTPENAQRLTEFTVKLNQAETTKGGEQIRELSRNIIEQAYSKGIISKEETIQRLMGIGYTLSDAEFLVKLADSLKQVNDNPDISREIKDRTTKLVFSAYATRSIGREEAIRQLMQLGLTQMEAGTELGLIDYDIQTKLKQRYVNSIQDLYTNWIIDKSQLFILLNDNGFNQSEVEAIIYELDLIRDSRTKLPTKEDLKRWVKNGIITLEQYVNDMKGQGFPDIYIERYVMELGVEL